MGEKSSPERGAAAGERESGETGVSGAALLPAGAEKRSSEASAAAAAALLTKGEGINPGSTWLSALAGSAGRGSGGITSYTDVMRPERVSRTPRSPLF